jgi:uroporphyrinogen decarboxylase
VTAGYLDAMQVNLFNYSFEHDVNEMRRLAGDGVTLMGNIPPRDVLGQGDCGDVQQSVAQMLGQLADRRRIIVSAGGFTPSQFCSEKIEAFCRAVQEKPSS